MALEQQIQTLQHMIDESKKLVFFGGAGVSTQSQTPRTKSSLSWSRQAS